MSKHGNSPSTSTRALDRRSLIKAGAGATGSMVVAGMLADHVAGQFDSTPPPAPVVTATQADPIPDLAAQLGYDQEAIFAFVRDEIHYESYAGVLRGAKGTLWARAGNSADQAVLLAALLDASQLPYRFAIGTLSDDAEARLIDALTPSQDRANAAYDQALSASEQEGVPDQSPAPVELTEAEQAVLEDAIAQAATVIDIAGESADSNRSLIEEALGTSNIELPQLPLAALVTREREEHCWIQLPDGPSWIDLDPTREANASASEVTATFNELPNDWFHAISVAIAVDELSRGSLSRHDVVSFESTSDRLINTPIAINVAPAGAIEGLGNAINQVMSGQMTMVPSIFVNGTSVDGSRPIVFGTGEAGSGSFLSTEGTPVPGAIDGEALAVWLTVDITCPDAEPQSIERAIIDRVPPLDRASGDIDPASILPLRTEPSAFEPDATETIVEFNRFIALSIDVARIPLNHAMSRSMTDPLLGPLHMFGPSLASNRDNLGIQHETSAGYWSYPSAPNVTAFNFTTSEQASGTGTMAVDILNRQRTSFRFRETPAETETHPLVLSGVLDAIAEHMLLSQGNQQDATDTPHVSVGVIFEQAAAQNVDVITLTTPPDLDAIDLPDAARIQIEEALDDGQVIIVPSQPVDIAGKPYTAWWTVDPGTGRTFDRMGDGSGGASGGFSTSTGTALASDTQTFYARWVAWLTKHAKALGCMGNVIGYFAGLAALLIKIWDDRGAWTTVILGNFAMAGMLLRMIGSCGPLV